MGRSTQFLGIFGLILFVFGVFTYELISYDEYHIVPAHLLLGTFCILVFVIRGGLGFLGSQASKRAAGFGAGVLVYSALFLGVLIFVNYIVLKHDFLRYDSTEEQVYTLAPQSVEVLKTLPQPVMARAFYVGKVDAEAESLLNRLQSASANFHWVWIDPEKKPTLMEQYGVSQSATIHFSFEGSSTTREAKVVHDINEQEIINALLKLTRGGEKKIYAVAGHGESDLDAATEGGFLFFKEAIQGENVKVEKLLLAEKKQVPEDASALLVMAPKKGFLPMERAAIEEYLRKGGNAVFFAEPRTTPDIAEIVKPLGIVVGQDIVVDQVVGMFSGPGLGVQPVVTQYGVHPATKDFNKETVFSTACSVFRAVNVPQGGTVTELALTSANSWAEKNLEKIFGENPTAALDPDDIRGPVSLAAVYEGPFPSGQLLKANAEGAVVDASTPSEKAADRKSVKVAVFGDVDYVANVNLRQLSNTDFFLNVMNWVLDQQNGVTIRAKSLRASRKVITTSQFDVIFLLTGIVFPELLLAGGLGVWWFRRR